MDKFTAKAADLFDAIRRLVNPENTDRELERAEYAFTEHLRDAINLVVNGEDTEDA